MIRIVKRNLSNHVYIYQIVMNSKDVIVNILVFVFWNTVMDGREIWYNLRKSFDSQLGELRMKTSSKSLDKCQVKISVSLDAEEMKGIVKDVEGVFLREAQLPRIP